MFDPEDISRYTNYWMQLKDHEGNFVGVIGIQLSMSEYDRLIPPAVIENPYSLSLISLYDKNLERIWEWGCKGESCGVLDIDKANPIIS